MQKGKYMHKDQAIPSLLMFVKKFIKKLYYLMMFMSESSYDNDKNSSMKIIETFQLYIHMPDSIFV